MTFLQTDPPEQAQGLLEELYQADGKGLGYVPNYTRVMSANPEAIQAWRALSGAIRGKLRLRTYELVTFAAALTLRCTY
jgi:alkylhydroperoxidase/carboxymuconolactone decarboxylase family protein YurZ